MKYLQNVPIHKDDLFLGTLGVRPHEEEMIFF